MRAPSLALGTAFVLAGSLAVAPVQAQVQPQDAADLVQGADGCALLTDEEVLRATGGTTIVSRTPGSPDFMFPAGCTWDIETADGFGTSQVLLSVMIEGGRQQFDMLVPFDDVGEAIGVGDEAVDPGFGSFLGVEGDAAVSIQTITFGAQRPDSLISRVLGWIALARLESAPPLLATAALAGPGVLPTDQPSLDAVAAIRTPEYGDDSVAATVDLLARAGIEVADPTTGEPLAAVTGTPSPVRLLDLQARSMALEVWAGSGLSGADLDSVIAQPDDMPLTSSLLAGWLAAVDTPDARLGRALMAGQDVSDPTSLRFPMLALLLFSADIVADAQSAAQPEAEPLAVERSAFLSGVAGGEALGTARTAQGGACSVSQTFVDDVITTVFDAVDQPVPGGAAGEVIEDIHDWLVAQGDSFARAAAAELTESVVTRIRDVAGLITVIGQVGAVAMPMFVTVSSSPAALVLPVAPAPPVDGEFVVRVWTVTQDWPLIVNECAQAAGVTLPSLSTAGKAVDWGSIEYATPPARSPLLTQGTADQALTIEAPHTARLRFRSDVETPELAQGPEHLVVVKTDATIPRDDLTAGLEAVVEKLFERFPSLIRPRVQEELQPEVDELLEELLSIVDARGTGTMTIAYHTPPEPTPPPDEEPDEARAVWVRLDRPARGAAVQAARVLELYSCSGPYGPWSGVLRAGGVGPVQLTDLPVDFTFPGTSGIQTTSTSTAGTLRWSLPGITSAVHYDIGVTVDGSSMVITIGGTANEQVGGQELLGGISVAGAPQSLAIEPAPEGSCPP